MTSYTSSSIDDQQERHYIGRLLYDDDPFGPPANAQFDSNSSSQPPVGSVLPSVGPIGPSPNQAFWPEPPPPYSPYSPLPPQWSSVTRQSSDVFNSSAPSSYGQPPSFYTSSMFNTHGGWNNIGGDSIDSFVGSGMSYTSHNNYANIVRPHIDGHYATSNVFPLRGNCYAGNYDPSDALQVETLPHFSSDEFYKPEGAFLDNGLMSNLPGTPPVIDAGTIMPLGGKSYRDAASEKKRANSSASAASALSNGSLSGEHGRSLKENQEPNPAAIKGSKRYPSDNAAEELRNANRVPSKVTLGSNAVKKTNSAPVKHSNENEFQKITRKKSKGSKVNKGEQIATDEDGLASKEAVDASSRFDVLQSLGSQAANNSRASSKLSKASAQKERRSAKLVKPGKVLNSSGAKAGLEVTSPRSKQSCGIDAESDLNEEPGKLSSLTSKVDELFQCAVLKKAVFNLRRDSLEQNGFETPRFACRKQRNGARKRGNTVADYLSLFIMTVFSLLKRAARWIVDLVIDISFLLKDVTIYSASKSYASFVFSCQRFWYSLMNNIKFSWHKLCNLHTHIANKFLKRETEEESGWGLNENIQMPSSGNEAMHRLLRCQGQDAYSVLGLRADCTSEEIKRHYKRLAFLVHPDKNIAEGSVEAFNILSKAFDAVGTPESRSRYDLTSQNSPVHKELAELWERFYEKMEEARTTLPCDCGKRHLRALIQERSPQQARYCRKCDVFHPAKHNDIWAESLFFGFWWTYYACLDGAIYNVTRWANCSKNCLKNLKPDAHIVQYCMVSSTTANKRDVSPKRFKKCCHQRYELDDVDYLEDDYSLGLDEELAYPTPHGYNDLGNAPQLAPCRSFDRRLFADRPRRAGRRKKLH